MALFSKDIETLDDLFEATLQAVYYAEHQIASTLPKLAERADDETLRALFQRHLTETEGQIRRLEQVFTLQDLEAVQGGCPAIDGILEAGASLADDEIEDEAVLDAGLIAAARLVEHYEIAQYGTLIAWARELGRVQSAQILEETLAEEQAAAEELGRIAERLAQAADSDAEEDEDALA